MEAIRFDTLLQNLVTRTGSRRVVVAAAMLGLGDAAGRLMSPDEGLAGRHTHHKPKPRSTYTCAAKANDGIGVAGDRPLGQIFTATRSGELRQIRVTVRNTSTRDGDEVVQVYVAGSGEGSPIRSLRAFQRIHLRAGESRQVDFALGVDALPSAAAEISVGGGQPLGSTPHVKGRF